MAQRLQTPPFERPVSETPSLDRCLTTQRFAWLGVQFVRPSKRPLRLPKPSAYALLVGLWACVSATTYAQTTITRSVAANSDDAEEEGPTGTTPNRIWLSSSDIELVSDFDPPTAGVQKVGLRFTAMTIPGAATITNAYLNFRAIAADAPMTNSDPTTLTIKGQLIADAPTFTITSGDISSRVLTSASASWVPTSWTTGSDYSSPSIASVIQEIVDQGTWASGNAVAIIITGTGHRASTAYDTDPPNAAELVVTYTTPVLFRSVGITATALATGAANALTISGGTATFGSSLPDNIGVGDVIQYDSDGNASIDALAFIHGRTNSQTYAVRDKNGAIPTAVIGDGNWSIYRAYTSLAFWESQSENSNILEPVENDVNPPLNLVTANTRLHVACYGDGPDTTAVTISGWTTGADTYIHIFTPNLSSQVGTTQRHRGVWDDTKYKLDVGNDQVIDIAGAGSGPSDVWIDGLQINLVSTNSNGEDGINIDQTTAANHRISNNIIRATSISHSAVYGIYAKAAAAAPAPVLRIWNNIIYGFNAQANNTAIYSDGDYGATFTVYAYNNTVYGCSRGYSRNGASAGPFIAKNNIAYNNADNYEPVGSTFDASSTSNLSGPGADAQMPATAARNGVTVTFVDAAGSPPDLHLSTAPADTGAMNWGADLSSDPNLAVVGDIDGEVRRRPGTSGRTTRMGPRRWSSCRSRRWPRTLRWTCRGPQPASWTTWASMCTAPWPRRALGADHVFPHSRPGLVPDRSDLQLPRCGPRERNDLLLPARRRGDLGPNGTARAGLGHSRRRRGRGSDGSGRRDRRRRRAKEAAAGPRERPTATPVRPL